MEETTARRWAYAAAATGMIANALIAAFFVSYARQHFGHMSQATADLGAASDYAGIPQNALLGVLTVIVYRSLSRQQRLDRILQVLGAVAFAAATVSSVLTVTGVQPGDAGAVAVGPIIVSAVWLLAIGSRGAGLPDLRRARVARLGQLIAVTGLAGTALVPLGFGISVTAIVWVALVAAGLAWFALPLWVLAVARALKPASPNSPASSATAAARR